MIPHSKSTTMTEKLLQFIWKFQYFNRNDLFTESGHKISIIKQGLFNQHQGPDFLEAAVKINHIHLVGNIELHVLSSDWKKHQHACDDNYSNIILHVVWKNDAEIKDRYHQIIPTLVLQNLVPKVLLNKYELLMKNGLTIACQSFLPTLSDIGWMSWKERLIAERLEKKSLKVLLLLKQSKQHWEEVFWWMLASNFGMKVNTEIFEQIAQTISINILAKHKNRIHQVEALLFGQANLLKDDFEEDYPILLKKEYQFLQKKYRLASLKNQPHFLRMRPANFPTIRLAQLAVLIQQSSHLFSKIKNCKEVKSIHQLFDITCNDYWHYHYVFDEITSFKPKQLGKQMIDNIIINTIAPVLFAYGSYTKEQIYKDKAIQWLQETVTEKNSIINAWKQMKIISHNAMESQALIELKNHYCNQKKCLQCAVGNKILNPTSENEHPA